MSKSTTIYWNALSPENRERWTSIKGLEGMAEEPTLTIDCFGSRAAIGGRVEPVVALLDVIGYSTD